MEERNERKMAGRPRNGRALTTAKPTAVGVIVPVTDPPDLWYLCEKARYARRFPYIRSDGERAMYQRRVSTWVRLDNENFAYRFPYCGEVGFNMSHRPPSPVMSKDEPFRPSTFPLSKYSLMKNRLLDGVSALLVEVDLLDKVELENVLSWTLEEDGKKVEVDPRIVRILKGGKVKGLLRIPDVLRLKVYDNPGEAQYSQANLKSVIEMKFPGDVLSPAQQEAYEIIAGPAGLRVLYTETCDCADREQWREWVKGSEKDPVYKPVQQVTSLASRMSIEKNKLLVGRIDEEHEKARRLLGGQLPHVEGPQWEAAPDPRLVEAQNRRAIAGLEMVLAAPFVAAAAGAAANVVVPARVVATGTVVAKSAGQSVPYRAVIEAVARKVLPASAAVSAPAFADPPDEVTQPQKYPAIDWNVYQMPASAQNYVIWENASVNINE
ncbi:hypothetical protein [Pseudomonas monteilii]|uniref:hypothetical protein n=1 Tax=Pseudomonas monteilii TaxID=76759 RepID=UPI0036E21FDC